MGLVRLIVIFFCIVLVMRLLRRFVLPLVFKKAGERIFRNMEDRMRSQTSQNDARKEGEIRVEKTKKTEKSKVEEGEYVDYEEVR